MSTIILSFLLLLLIAAGMLMAKPLHERFVSSMGEVKVSPALLNLIATPTVKPESVQVDTLAREQDLVKAAACPKCPKQKECPDMSQYIRLDEIPCWNCSLP